MPRVLVALPQKNNRFHLHQTEAARRAAVPLGVDVDFLYADNNAVLQIQQILRAIRADPAPRAIVVEPVATQGLETVLRKAAAMGIGTAVLAGTLGYVEALRAEFPDVAVFRVASDQVEIGRLQGRQARALLPAGGGILYVHGPHAAPAAQQRFRGFQEIVGSLPSRLVVLDGYWTEDSALRAVSHWLRLKTSVSAGIHLVAAQDDAMALGARRALESCSQGDRWARIPYLGIGGVPEEGRRLVDERRLSATVVLPASTGVALEHLARWMRGGAVPPSVSLGVSTYPGEPGTVKRSA